MEGADHLCTETHVSDTLTAMRVSPREILPSRADRFNLGFKVGLDVDLPREMMPSRAQAVEAAQREACAQLWKPCRTSECGRALLGVLLCTHDNAHDYRSALGTAWLWTSLITHNGSA